MTILSTRFAVLACLCAALPLAPSVDAAHLHGSHSMKKHTSSAHSPQRTHNPSFFGGPTTVHKHDDQHHAHRVSNGHCFMRRVDSLIHDPLCRRRTTQPRNFHPFYVAIVSMITKRFTTTKARIITTTPMTKSHGLLLREAAIVESLTRTVVVPRYMSPGSTVTRI